LDCKPDILRQVDGENLPIVGILGDCSKLDPDYFFGEGIDEVKRVTAPYKLASRQYRADYTEVKVDGIKIGQGNPLVIMAGPCAVESEEQILRIAREVKTRGRSNF